MASVNLVILVGNLTRDVEIRYTPAGKAVANFTIATNDSWTDANGQKQERSEFTPIVVWGKQGENCLKYLSKGRTCYVEGSLRSRSFDGKDGNKRYVTEVIANRVEFIGAKKEAGGGVTADHVGAILGKEKDSDDDVFISSSFSTQLPPAFTRFII